MALLASSWSRWRLKTRRERRQGLGQAHNPDCFKMKGGVHHRFGPVLQSGFYHAIIPGAAASQFRTADAPSGPSRRQPYFLFPNQIPSSASSLATHMAAGTTVE
jgi:hypothetical protein